MYRRIGEGHEELKRHMIPSWAPGCRRVTPGDGYLEALVQNNVEPVFSGIEKVLPDGIVTADGNVHKLDILVCATGFAVAFKPGFRVINGDGRSIDEDWGSSVKSVFSKLCRRYLANYRFLNSMYLGLAAPRFPNYFTVVGPGATWSNGTLLPSVRYLEFQTCHKAVWLIYNRSRQLSSTSFR